MAEQYDKIKMLEEAKSNIHRLETEIPDFINSLGLNDEQFKNLEALLVEFRGSITVEAMINGLNVSEKGKNSEQDELQKQELLLRQNLLSFRHNRNFRL